MTTALVILAVVDGIGFLAVGYMARAQRAERADWAHERRQLVDRVIARHTGEVIALDRNEKPRAKQPPEPERLIEGMS